MTLRAAIYARYSTEMQRAASIEDQVRLCRERLDSEGWDFMQAFTDRAMSGASTLRPGYQRLIEAVRAGAVDVVVAEALDRLSRDQEDIAAMYKRLRFAGVRIVTLSEGEINELHVGLKGTMNALFLKDLAAKTHRGLRGRVEAGRSGGGNAYGYRVVRRFDANGTPTAGEREIDAAEARTVDRIFRAYAAGTSPREIALSLNRDGVRAPRTESWSASTINGNRGRGTGILNNELYIGRLTWNRLTYVKDPDTGKRRSRARANQDIIVTEVPELRIVEQAVWDAVKARQKSLDQTAQSTAEPSTEPQAPFWSKQRPRYLFSGLMQCGSCGGGFSMVGRDIFGCSKARNKGPTVCTNRITIRRATVEGAALDGLANRIMDPERFKQFVAEFTAEWNRQQAEASGEQDARREELIRVNATIERLVTAIGNGAPTSSITPRLRTLEERRMQLSESLADAVAPAPRLHPNLAELYRKTVADLAEALQWEGSAEARDMVRSLVEAIVLTPEHGTLRIEVHGQLASILSLSAAGRAVSSEAEGADVARQVKMVAGTGFEPVTFRL